MFTRKWSTSERKYDVIDEPHPSHLDLPITRGNIIGTFFSGGDISSFGLSR